MADIEPRVFKKEVRKECNIIFGEKLTSADSSLTKVGLGTSSSQFTITVICVWHRFNCKTLERLRGKKKKKTGMWNQNCCYQYIHKRFSSIDQGVFVLNFSWLLCTAIRVANHFKAGYYLKFATFLHSFHNPDFHQNPY